MEGSQGNRVLIKLSGEALSGSKQQGIDYGKLNYFTEEIISVCKKGYKVALVIGGGNILRGVSVNTNLIERSAADYMGMVATLINSLGFTSALNSKNCKAHVFSSINVDKIANNYSASAVEQSFINNDVAVIACGTGIPYFSTDTAAVLRALELKCNLLIKATQVDGVYNKDPKVFKDANRYDKISYDFVLENNLKIMDMSAVILAKENKLDLKICNVHTEGTLSSVVSGNGLYTLITS